MQNGSMSRGRLDKGDTLIQGAYESICDLTSPSECVLSSLELKLPRDEGRDMECDEESWDGNEGLKLLGGGPLVFPLLAARG